MTKITIQSHPCEERTDNGTVTLRFPPIFSDDELPYVSVVTITRNRSEFYPLLIRNMSTCDYPKDRIEWVIVEDGTSVFDINSAKERTTIQNIVYRHLGDLKFPIGYKRNLAVKLSSHDTLVHIDDDDYYPPESILARVRALTIDTLRTRCVGCLSVRTFHLFTERTFEAYESSDINMSESSLAYTRSFWKERMFENKCSFAEGILFLKHRYDECKSLPHVFVIVQFDHTRNTVTRLCHEQVYYDSKVPFLSTVDADTVRFVLTLRDNVAMCIPDTRTIIDFIQRHDRNFERASLNLHTLPSHLQRHPLALQLCRSYKTKTKTKCTGVVVFYCGAGEHIGFNNKWDYDTPNIGGSEEAVLLLSKQLTDTKSETKFRVHIYNERDDVKAYNNGRIVFKPWYTFRPLNEMYAFVSWRDPTHFKMFPNLNTERCLLDLHDAIPPSWTSTLPSSCTVMVKSQFQCTHYNTCPNVRIVPNGIQKFKKDKKNDKNNKDKSKKDKSKKDKERIVLCTSSPERCWHTFFKLAKEFSDNDSSDIRFVHAYEYERMKSTKHWETLGPLFDNNHGTVTLLGHVSHTEIDEWYRRATFFVYPTLFPEIDCVSLSKAIDANCICVHTSAGAMKEKSEKYGTVCVPVRNTSFNDTSFALNDEEYIEFRNVLKHTINNNYNEKCECEEVPSIEQIGEEWINVLKN